MSKPVRIRKTNHKETLSDHIYKHSPIKKGTVVVKNEDKPYKNYNKMMNKIYLGNINASKDKEFFAKKNIKAVLNCTKDIPNTFRSQDDIEYMRIPIDDSLKEVDFEKALQFMPAAIEFIHKHAVLQNETVFIHCHAGRQRSIAMLVAYLINKLEMPLKQACKFVLQKRPEAFHFGLSLNFESSLEKYAKTLKKCKK